jgi:hypothetical protein
LTQHNYREVMHRFTHIDGEIRCADARMCCGEDEASVRIVVRLYPWWEHPQYIAARASGAAWGFDYGDDAARDLVIEAVRPQVCELTGQRSATDLAFVQEAPELWRFEDEAEIFCNSDVDRTALFDAVIRRKLPGVTSSVLEGYLSSRTQHRAPYSLGYFPNTLFHVLKEELERMAVRTHLSREPSPRPVPVMMSINDSALVIADDFTVEVPEFKHRPEWFRPPTRPGAG